MPFLSGLYMPILYLSVCLSVCLLVSHSLFCLSDCQSVGQFLSLSFPLSLSISLSLSRTLSSFNCLSVCPPLHIYYYQNWKPCNKSMHFVIMPGSLYLADTGPPPPQSGAIPYTVRYMPALVTPRPNNTCQQVSNPNTVAPGKLRWLMCRQPRLMDRRMDWRTDGPINGRDDSPFWATTTVSLAGLR